MKYSATAPIQHNDESCSPPDVVPLYIQVSLSAITRFIPPDGHDAALAESADRRPLAPGPPRGKSDPGWETWRMGRSVTARPDHVYRDDALQRHNIRSLTISRISAVNHLSFRLRLKLEQDCTQLRICYIVLWSD